MRLNLYLDVDGTLMANTHHLATGAAEFIKFATDNFSVFWLTTHCMDGRPEPVVNHVQSASQENLRPYLEKIQPTTWSVAKTEAIDFSLPFLWFDDDCYGEERTDLETHHVLNSWIEVNLADFPNQLTHELERLKSLVTNDPA